MRFGRLGPAGQEVPMLLGPPEGRRPDRAARGGLWHRHELCGACRRARPSCSSNLRTPSPILTTWSRSLAGVRRPIGRDFQLVHSGGSKGKAAPGFSPVGPWLVTPDEVDPQDLRLRSWVNGQTRQDSSTRGLSFDVPYLVWHLSLYLRLEPGALILTGTPEGVALSGRFPYLTAGDVVEVEIEGLGRQRTLFVAEGTN